MSRLSFMVNFPWGEPTHFREKIDFCQKYGFCNPYLTESHLADNLKHLNLDPYPKLHTIRESPYLSRFIGKKIAMYNWAGVPYKSGSRHDVFKELPLLGFQQIGIIISPSGMIGITVYEDGPRRELSPLEVQQLIKNDGLTVKQFRQYFHKPECWSEYRMFIYHWTNLRY